MKHISNHFPDISLLTLFPSLRSAYRYFPVLFGLEGLDLVVPLHTEAERRRLAGPVGDERGVQITVPALSMAPHVTGGGIFSSGVGA